MRKLKPLHFRKSYNDIQESWNWKADESLNTNRLVNENGQRNRNNCAVMYIVNAPLVVLKPYEVGFQFIKLAVLAKHLVFRFI